MLLHGFTCNDCTYFIIAIRELYATKHKFNLYCIVYELYNYMNLYIKLEWMTDYEK